MQWILFKKSIKTSWIWLKTHWHIPFIITWTIVVWILSRGNVKAVTQVLEAKKESYEKQIEALKSAHVVEIKKREELHLKYKETLDTIEKDFKLKEEELSVIKKKKIKQIIKSSKENPHEINKKIEDLFGFTRVN
jgi:uncharacterized protein YjhX (UPF0386 family)